MRMEHITKSNNTKRKNIYVTTDGMSILLKKKKKDEDENIIGKCLQCKKTYSGRLFSTSNWLRHLKVSEVLITGDWLNKFTSL